MATGANRRDGSTGIKEASKDATMRIWCNHCDKQHQQVSDMKRHYINAADQGHTAHAHHVTEMQFWCFEEYAHSRHGTSTHAALARTRTQEILGNLQNGKAVTAPPIGPTALGSCTATLASAFRGKAKEARDGILALHVKHGYPAPPYPLLQAALTQTLPAQAVPVQAAPAPAATTQITAPQLTRTKCTNSAPARPVPAKPRLRPARVRRGAKKPVPVLEKDWSVTSAGRRAKAENEMAAGREWLEVAARATAREKECFVQMAELKLQQAAVYLELAKLAMAMDDEEKKEKEDEDEGKGEEDDE